MPLPKINEIYARLKGSNIYSTFDMRSGYYHMVLSEKSRPKSAFVSSFGKWEFKRCPFGLSQAPTYFQRLVNEVLLGLTPKEVKQFLGLIGYYRKFVPRFSDIAHPLNALTRKNVAFEWTPVCQESFELLKTSLMTEPILTYPDPNLPYVLFTDASKYALACVLTQEKTHIMEEKEVKILHPITYMSGLFRGSQMNWACLTKRSLCNLYVNQETCI